MSDKESRVSVRVNAGLKARIEEITKRTGIDEATLVRNCIEALCDHVERTGQISFPLAVNAAPGATGQTRYPKPTPRHDAMHEPKKKK